MSRRPMTPYDEATEAIYEALRFIHGLDPQTVQRAALDAFVEIKREEYEEAQKAATP